MHWRPPDNVVRNTLPFPCFLPRVSVNRYVMRWEHPMIDRCGCLPTNETYNSPPSRIGDSEWMSFTETAGATHIHINTLYNSFPFCSFFMHFSLCSTRWAADYPSSFVTPIVHGHSREAHAPETLCTRPPPRMALVPAMRSCWSTVLQPQGRKISKQLKYWTRDR